MDMVQVEGSEITRILNLKGTSRLEVKDEFTEKILEQKNIVFPGGLKFCFIESKKHSGEGGNWAEYKILYSVLKYEETMKYLQTVLSLLGDSKLFPDIDKLVDYISLEEFDCSRPRYYYILIGARKNIGEEIKENEIKELFKTYE